LREAQIMIKLSLERFNFSRLYEDYCHFVKGIIYCSVSFWGITI